MFFFSERSWIVVRLSKKRKQGQGRRWRHGRPRRSSGGCTWICTDSFAGQGGHHAGLVLLRRERSVWCCATCLFSEVHPSPQHVRTRTVLPVNPHVFFTRTVLFPHVSHTQTAPVRVCQHEQTNLDVSKCGSESAMCAGLYTERSPLAILTNSEGELQHVG